MTTAEEWRPVVGYEGSYEVSDLGRVRGVPRIIVRSNGAPQTIKGRILAQHPLSDGSYLKVDLSRDGGFKSRPVHRLVGEAFYGPLPDGMQTRHLNGNGFDNRLANLRYGTHLENMRDSVEHGTHVSLRFKARTHCANNHPYDERTRYAPTGSRICARCDVARTIASQKRVQARREAAGEVTPHAIREWAAPIFGIDPTLTGRIHDDIKWAYAYAHPEKGWTPTPDPRRTSFAPPTVADLMAAHPRLAEVLDAHGTRAA